jgi:hypothetical protein
MLKTEDTESSVKVTRVPVFVCGTYVMLESEYDIPRYPRTKYDVAPGTPVNDTTADVELTATAFTFVGFEGVTVIVMLEVAAK